MAEAIVSAVVGDAVSRVINLLTGHFSHQQQSTEAKVRRICHMVTRIRSAVEEAKGRQIPNHGALQWLSELIDGEYQGRYLLDTISCCEHHELEEDDEHGGDRVIPQASSLSLFNPAKRMRVAASAVRTVLSRRDLSAGEVDMVLENLQGASADLREFIMLLQGYQPIQRPLATNIFLDGQMFGRHVEKETIINFLLHDDGGHATGELGVLPIVGDIGVGKTTLVQHVCDDARVRNHFPVIMLLNFSCTYAVAASEVTVVLRSKHVIRDGELNLNDPLQLVKRNFGNKRFLMVFEDVDMRKKRMLEEMLPNLRCGVKGSKIIFTTNSPRVVTIGTVEPIILKVLPCPEYWFFFKAHVFAGSDIEENPRLVAVGKAIARKLNGSFFSAKIVGGLLKDRPDPKFWCKVLRSNIGGLSLVGDGIGYVADLAENLLPNHVDICMVAVSKYWFSTLTELTKFPDLCGPHCGETCLADDVSFATVLLCKSVLPFYNLYHTASCSIGSSNSCSEIKKAY